MDWFLYDSELRHERNKVTLSGMKKFLAAKSPFKMMKNAFCFILEALFVLELFKFLFGLLGHAGKWLDNKAKVNFKICDVTDWITNNYNTHTARYLSKGN